MNKKIVFVSNRLPVTIIKNDNDYNFNPSIGGLATGLKSIHEENNSLWVGWCGLPSDKLDINDKKIINKKLQDEYKSVPIFLSNKELDKYYSGFSNNTIWPLFHYFTNYTIYDNDLWKYYKTVNKKYLKKLKTVINDGDTIWVHDYQLMLLPKMIKDFFPNSKIGFFLHIPFPSFEIFRLMPWRKKILTGILGADLIGFHTYDYVRHFVSSIRRLLGHEYNLGLISVDNHVIKVDSFPMGIDYEHYSTAHKMQTIQNEAREIVEKTKGTKVILSVDRLDYTKGITERIRAFNLFLKNNPQYKEKVTMILIIAPSRTAVDTYKELLKEIEELISHTNGEHGTLGWIPVWFFYRTFSSNSLIALYGIADVMLVTPLRDGMNLIAKEYIASRIDKKGVLILSETAGAASELGEAIIVNPNNIKEVAESIKEAIEMPEEIQIEKNTIMHRRLKRYDVYYWAKDFMDKLKSIHEIQEQKKSQKLKERNKESILNDYKNGKKRIILLDYDGTLVPFFNKPDMAKPDNEVLELLNKLIIDKKNTIVIISGRDKDTLEKWFGELKINLVAGHGMWIREIDAKWEMTEVLGNNWKEEIRPVLEIHTNRTPGSFIEEKDFSLAWHYRRCDPDLASIRVSELKEALMNLTRNLNIGLLDGNKVIEVKDTTINKGRGVTHWLGKESYDFILSIGDDWTDEDMFSVLPKNAYSIKIGYHLSHARFTIDSVESARNLLKSLVE